MPDHKCIMLESHFLLNQHEIIGDIKDLDVVVNGYFGHGDEAIISVSDHGLLYGDGIFEGIRAYEGGVFKLDEHLYRLYDSAKAIGLALPFPLDELRCVVLETLKRNALRDAHVRVVVTRGVGNPGVNPATCRQPGLAVMAYPFPPLLGDKPARLLTSNIRRKAPQSVDARVKSLNYLDNVLFKVQAISAGMDDGIMLDGEGCIAETTGANVFAVIRGLLATPTLTAALPGITRLTVIELAKELGYQVEERRMTLGDLYVADEIFLTGTATGIAPVGEIDGRTIGSESSRPITKHLIDSYKKMVTSSEHVTHLN